MHEDLCFQTVSELSKQIAAKKLSPVELTKAYLERSEELNPKLAVVLTLIKEEALKHAATAEQEIRSGKVRGPLHGIPYGVKDLLDTKGIRTTWGAEFYRDRVPAQDAAVVAKLDAAGAVLIAKLSLGALALNDVWFGGQTMNPWLLDEGASGS